jgi:non-homologous end joining protein Ku
MPRASWRGFLRLSLVSCPIYLSPATTRAKSIRLHQVWQPTPVDVAEDGWSEVAPFPTQPPQEPPLQ